MLYLLYFMFKVNILLLGIYHIDIENIHMFKFVNSLNSNSSNWSI